MSLRWKNLRIIVKILLCIGALVSILAGLSVYSVSGVKRIIEYGEEAIAHKDLAAELLQREIDHLKWAQTASIFVFDEQAQKLSVQVDPTKCSFGEWYYGKARTEIEQQDPKMREFLADIEEPHRRLHESAERIAAARKEGRQAEVVATFKETSLPALRNVQEILQAMRKIAGEEGEAEERALVETGHKIESSTTSFSIAAVLAGLALGSLVAFSISRPIGKGVRFANAIAAGDLTQPLDVRQDDEVGQFCASLANIRDTVKNVLAEYDAIVRNVEVGQLLARGEAKHFNGGFAELIAGANRIADIFVGHLDAIPTPVMTIDRDYTVQYMNKAGIGVAGGSAMGRKCHDLFRTSDCKTDKCACGRAMREARMANSETDAHPAGRDLDISYSGVPIRDRKGNVAGALEIVIDQTSVVAARRRMQRCADEAMSIAHLVSSAAEELSAQVTQSSRGAELEALRLSETATAMEEMNSTVLEVAGNASRSATSSDDARQKAQEGAQIVSRMMGAIGEVQQRTAELKNNMSELGKRAEGIGAVMNVISDIADQTNLLALNAAIEAARAGDAGRGFAVVADEVRKLAEKTMAATKEVGDAITGIQHETRANISSVEAAAKMIENATQLANMSGQSLGEIVKLVELASDQVRSIATASEQQSAASEEINRAIEEVSRIASETSTAMQQSSQAITELSNQTTRLNGLIDELQDAKKA